MPTHLSDKTNCSLALGEIGSHNFSFFSPGLQYTAPANDCTSQVSFSDIPQICFYLPAIHALNDDTLHAPFVMCIGSTTTEMFLSPHQPIVYKKTSPPSNLMDREHADQYECLSSHTCKFLWPNDSREWQYECSLRQESNP